MANKPVLNPKEDLKGATPETLAKALLRSSGGRKAVVPDKVSVKKVAADKPGNRSPHLKKGS